MAAGRARTALTERIATYSKRPVPPRDPDNQHHAGQQHDCVEVHAADRLVLRQDTGHDDQARADPDDEGAIDPVHDDGDVGEQEERGGEPQRIETEEEVRRLHETHRWGVLKGYALPPGSATCAARPSGPLASGDGNSYLGRNPAPPRSRRASCPSMDPECPRRARTPPRHRRGDRLRPVGTNHPAHLRRAAGCHHHPHRFGVDRRGRPPESHPWLPGLPPGGSIRAVFRGRFPARSDRGTQPHRSRPEVFGRRVGPHHPARGPPRRQIGAGHAL